MATVPVGALVGGAAGGLAGAASDAHKTPPEEQLLTLDEWLQNDGELLNQALDESVAGMAEQMAKDIRYKD